MSKIFAKYVVVGDSEDMQAFEAIVRHISKCQTLGCNRDIKISVDGDGSADLRFYREESDSNLPDLNNGYKLIEYLDYPKEVRDKLFKEEEDVELGEIGVMKSNGDGEYYIGE